MKNTNAKVEILKFAAFYNEGERGARGGAAKNDKVWGIARINGTTVSFNARRGGKMSFKTYDAGTSYKAFAKYEEKIGARTDGGDIYTPVNNAGMRDLLVPNLEKDLVSHYFSKMARNMLNTRH